MNPTKIIKMNIDMKKHNHQSPCLWAGLTLLAVIIISILFFQEVMASLAEALFDVIF